MTGPEVTATYFSPFMYFVYLVLVLVGMTLYYQWAWAKKSNNYVKVFVVKPDGSTNTEYAPKSGGYVALKTIESNTTRLWPINKLSAIETLYPGDGFFPMFLQKKIKTVIVDDEDWEPMLNRGSYSERVASPDVVQMLREIADAYPDATAELTDLADSLATAPTRAMVASPAVLGNVMTEKVSEMAVTISKETLDRMEGFAHRLDKLPNAMITYCLLGVLIVLMGVQVFRILPAITGLEKLKDISDGIIAIKKSLGVP